MTTATKETPDITVTSTTQTEEQVRAELGVPEPEAKPPVPPVAEKTPEQQEVEDADAALQQEVDKIEPPKAGETADEKRVRQSRGTKKILKEIALRKQAEDRADAAERELKTLRTSPPAPKPAPTPAAKAPDAPPADGTPPAQKFEFPTFDEFQEQNPDADLRDYTIALTDARTEFNKARDREQHEADARAAEERELTTTFQTAQTEFETEHPDYREKLRSIALPPNRQDGSRPPILDDLEELVVKAGKDGPKVLYHLGTHPDETKRLLSARNHGELLLTFGEVRYAARTSLTAAPAAADPPVTTPKTKAPAPISPTPGEHKTERTLQEIADEGEDADAYIERRQPKRRAS